MQDEYKNIQTGEKVKIVSDFGNSYLLDNNKTITKQAFSLNYAFTQMTKNIKINETKMDEQVIDPSTFFKKQASNIDFSNLTTPITLGTGGAVDINPSPQQNFNQGGDGMSELEKQYKRMMEAQASSRQPQFNDLQAPINNINPYPDVIFSEPKKQDPLGGFLASAKRSHNMVINVEMDYSIPNPDFIRMMADNLEGDFIKTYADEFISNMLSDRALLYDKVYEKIKNEIYGEKTQAKKRTTKK